MGPLDRYAFRTVVSIALHLTLAVVCGVIGGLVVLDTPVLGFLGFLAALGNVGFALWGYLRLSGFVHTRHGSSA